MRTISPPPAMTELGTDAEADALCAACPHPRTTHDEIGSRYCAATIEHGHHRGCVCPDQTINAGDTVANYRR